jgi:hypothetical protein
MSYATLDRVLAVLVVGMAATGLLTLRAGTPATGWVYVLHGVLAGALLAATVVKLRRSVPRAVRTAPWRRLLLAALVSLVTVAALTGGYLWATSDELLSIGAWTVLTLHAWVGLALVPLVVIHLLPTRWRLLRPAPSGATRRGRRLSRRTVLAAGGLALAGVATIGATGAIDALRGGTRRFTGSRWLPAGGIPPPTTFFGEGPPSIDVEAWRLHLTDSIGVGRSWSLADLRAMGEVERSVVLDCTSGWAMDTTWRGVPLPVVLAQDSAAGEDGPDGPDGPWLIRSATGWATVLSADEVAESILAWDVAGAPLPLLNGAPLRLVVPSRRGLDWVKWVTEIRPA